MRQFVNATEGCGAVTGGPPVLPLFLSRPIAAAQQLEHKSWGWLSAAVMTFGGAWCIAIGAGDGSRPAADIGIRGGEDGYKVRGFPEVRLLFQAAGRIEDVAPDLFAQRPARVAESRAVPSSPAPPSGAGDPAQFLAAGSAAAARPTSSGAPIATGRGLCAFDQASGAA